MLNGSQVLLVLGIVLIIVVLAAGLALWRKRRSGEGAALGESSRDGAVEAADRRDSVETRGSQLLDRRIQLDTSRGTLGGDERLSEELESLEQRFHLGEIAEEEYEREKTRLLGG